jgi:sulfite reductase (ferredoxin)
VPVHRLWWSALLNGLTPPPFFCASLFGGWQPTALRAGAAEEKLTIAEEGTALQSWKGMLASRIAPTSAREIDDYERQMELRQQGKIDDKVFAEIRLRRGVYGQRYDNGQRHDGEETREIVYPRGELLKGPNTRWDAPGMQRIKIPFGGLTAEQMDMLADVAEEYADSILHITTRQDIQLHFVHIDDTPDLHRRLAAVGITTREACGNTVRNVTACPLAGICRDEAFDVSPYSKATAYYLLGHRDTQDFGRKFKIAFSGCSQHACGLVVMHDMGAIACTRIVDGVARRGFQLYVGGGLGAIPYPAKLLDEFVPEQELLPTAQAIARVFARLGEKRNRARARIKFLVAKLGIEEFRRLVSQERKALPHDAKWTDWIASVDNATESALPKPVSVEAITPASGFRQWRQTNVYRQRQPGFVAASVTLPLGDLSAEQMRNLAAICRRYVKDTIRTTVEQNILLRWVHEVDLPALHRDLQAIGLGEPGAQSIVDVTACPGTDTCKLGIASSRGLAATLRQRLAAKSLQYDETLKDLRIKISGCFNSCGQHHLAEIGFYGVGRTVGNYKVPHFRLILGGRWSENGKDFGLSIGAIPSKRIPETVDRLLDLYLREHQFGEHFSACVARIGKKEIKAMLQDLMRVPPHELDPSLYVDWGDAREFTIGDIGVGECAGEVVSLVDFAIAAAENEVFEAQLFLDGGAAGAQRAADKALAAMLTAARGLIQMQNPDIGSDAELVLAEFRRHFYDTQLFFDPFAGGKFARLMFQAFATRAQPPTAELAHRRVEEAQLFIEATHACHARLLEAQNKRRRSAPEPVVAEALS